MGNRLPETWNHNSPEVHSQAVCLYKHTTSLESSQVTHDGLVHLNAPTAHPEELQILAIWLF